MSTRSHRRVRVRTHRGARTRNQMVLAGARSHARNPVAEMSVFLDSAEADEPLFGVVARYGKQMFVHDWRSFISGLFGYLAPLNTGLAYNLDEVAHQTSTSFGLTGSQIAEKLTLFPYYASFCAPDLRYRLQAEVLRRSSRILRGDLLKLIQRPRVIRMCRDCLETDKGCGLPLTWRRVHQLPGVVICPTHGGYLREFPQIACPSRAWPIPEDFSNGVATSFVSSRTHRPGIVAVATISQRILQDSALSFRNLPYQSWLEGARLAGYQRGRNTLESAKVAKDLVDFYGAEYLSHCELLPVSRQNWIVGRVTGAQTSAMALPQVLLYVFFENKIQNVSESWPTCPSRFAAHGPGHRVEVRIRSGGKYFCQCQCGMAFVGTRGEAPTRTTVSVYGEPYACEAQTLHWQGLSTADIAGRLGVSETTARRFVHKDQAYVQRTLSDFARNVALDWRTHVSILGSVSTVQKQCDGLYRRTRRYVPEEIEKSRIRRNLKR
ncbi:hypothetical protein E1N52_38405 [Paraburkholderia guartelaensis]|uniref:Uncharacterized protein n=2 Tax=Paraburkholderia guartelaensis TaxID=2546446 RepID=A0A4R5L511_9BURK|nr:hypothetical protein E1N52_38405 [Paraburkholderia guartelaensis]